MMTSEEAIQLLDTLTEAHDRGAVALALAGMSIKDIAAAQPFDVHDGWSPPDAYDYGKALTKGEAKMLLGLAGSRRDYAILYLAVVVGLRQIELRRLRWQDVDVATNSITVTGKGGKRRTVPVGTDVSKLLPEGDGYVFLSQHGNQISESGMRLIISGYLDQVSPSSTPHALRHTSLTWMLESGADIQTAMELAGHATISSHEIYAATSSSWLVQEWEDKHPFGGMPMVTVRVPGTSFTGKMARGVERAVMVPRWLKPDVQAALAYFQSAKQLTNRSRKLGLRFKEIRDAASIALTEADAHPFLIAMMMGTTPSNVVRRNFDRMTISARRGREEAVSRLGIDFTFVEV
jgi:hypothetical protein